jgi:hypothetical protein
MGASGTAGVTGSWGCGTEKVAEPDVSSRSVLEFAQLSGPQMGKRKSGDCAGLAVFRTGAAGLYTDKSYPSSYRG